MKQCLFPHPNTSAALVFTQRPGYPFSSTQPQCRALPTALPCAVQKWGHAEFDHSQQLTDVLDIATNWDLTHFWKGPPVGWEGSSPLGHVVPASYKSAFEINIATSLLASFCLRFTRPDRTSYSNNRQRGLCFTSEVPPAHDFFTPLGSLIQERDSQSGWSSL